ncbi:MAG: triose-phosphate isomerase, partial [Planctomycetota bacterium]
MARTTMIAGNWKMNLTPAEGEALVKGLADKVGSGVAAEVLVCPTFTG